MPLGTVIGPHERELWLVLRPQCVLPCGHWAPVGPTPTACSNPERGWPTPRPSATWVSDVCGERAPAGQGHVGQDKDLGTGVSSPSGVRRVARSCPISWALCLGQLVGLGTPESPWGWVAAGGSRHRGSRKWGGGRRAELRGAGLRLAPPPPGQRPSPRAAGRVTGGLSFLVLLV